MYKFTYLFLRSALCGRGVFRLQFPVRLWKYRNFNRRFLPFGGNNLHNKYIFFRYNHEKYVKNADFLKKFENLLELFGFIG